MQHRAAPAFLQAGDRLQFVAQAEARIALRAAISSPPASETAKPSPRTVASEASPSMKVTPG